MLEILTKMIDVLIVFFSSIAFLIARIGPDDLERVELIDDHINTICDFYAAQN